jgi:acetyl/propionyl-CoA carboxylase alpha subunit
MRRALEEYQIAGVTTNLRLYRALMNSTRFLGGQFDTGFVEERFPAAAGGSRGGGPEGWEADSERRLAAALTAALLDHRRREGMESEEGRISRWKMLGRWELTNRWG